MSPALVVHRVVAARLVAASIRPILFIIRDYDLRVILVVLTVLLVVQLLGLPLGMVLGLFPVDKVEALGLEQLVDLGTGKASKDLLGKAVVDSLAWMC